MQKVMKISLKKKRERERENGCVRNSQIQLSGRDFFIPRLTTTTRVKAGALSHPRKSKEDFKLCRPIEFFFLSDFFLRRKFESYFRCCLDELRRR